MKPRANSERLLIALSGMISGDPNQGGASWAVLQYLLGLRRLGHDVFLVEPIATDLDSDAGRASAHYLTEVAARFELEEVALLGPNGDSAFTSPEQLRRRLREADLLLNVSGMLAVPELVEAVPVRAFLDLDPFFNQHWQLQGAEMGFAAHTHFVTVATGIGGSGNEVPTLGLPWIETLPPVVLDEWPAATDEPTLPFTSVGHWRSYGPIEHEGKRYGLRAHSQRELVDLPRRTEADFALALAIHPEERRDLEALEENGWRLLDPASLAGTPDRYREFVRASSAEIAIAKEGYVRSRSGWFSDRSACYLASGRPVLAQDTGFDRALPTGTGLLSFSDVAEAAAGADEILSRPREHAAAARQIAEELLDSDRVLRRLLEALGAEGR